VAEARSFMIRWRDARASARERKFMLVQVQPLVLI
jgi:hypothetical protein